MDTTIMIERLKEFDGIDYAVVVERFCGDEELLATCIEQFTEDTGFGELENALENKDMSAAFEAAHTLKGVSTNLGLTKLYCALCALVEELRGGKGENADKLFLSVKDKLNELKSIVFQ